MDVFLNLVLPSVLVKISTPVLGQMSIFPTTIEMFLFLGSSNLTGRGYGVLISAVKWTKRLGGLIWIVGMMYFSAGSYRLKHRGASESTALISPQISSRSGMIIL